MMTYRIDNIKTGEAVYCTANSPERAQLEVVKQLGWAVADQKIS